MGIVKLQISFSRVTDGHHGTRQRLFALRIDRSAD